MNDFNKDLEYSSRQSDCNFWLECYQQAFPCMTACCDHRADGDHQRVGIDRSVVIENGKVYYIDEKVRRAHYTNQCPEGDILLEEWSSEEKKVPGWAIKPLWADYIAYAIIPIQTCFLMPVTQMQEAWRRNAEQWKAKYKKCSAPNFNYTTIGWAIPIPELYREIGKCLRIKWK